MRAAPSARDAFEYAEFLSYMAARLAPLRLTAWRLRQPKRGTGRRAGACL